MENTNPNTNPNGTQIEGQSENKTSYTKEEVEALLQRETDRRVTSALKKQQEKNDAKLREAEKLAQMDATQRFQYQLDERERAIAEKERQLSVAENTNQASKILNERGLSLDLVGLVVSEEAEDMMENINKLDKAFKASVKAEVERRLASSSPKKNLPTDGVITKEQFRKMSLGELSQLRENNPELYNELRG